MRFKFSINFLLCFFGLWGMTWGQSVSEGTISGSLELAGNFFIKDTLIGAAGLPQYERQLSGADAWFDVKYSNWGFDFGLRYDLFQNSNLLNPEGSYSDQGIGRWFIRKRTQRLEIEAGFIYDVAGSGLLYRFWEERPLAIDNALRGVKVAYDLTDDIRVKGFTGKQKRQFERYESTVKGGNIEGYFAVGKDKKINLAPGLGIINRTLDDDTVDDLVALLATYTKEDSIGARYNTYAFSVYNTLSVGNFTWFFEGAYKTEEPIDDPFAIRTFFDGSKAPGKFVSEDGYIIYSSMSYAQKGFGISAEFKRNEYYRLWSTPLLPGSSGPNQALINFLPPMNRINTYQLTARYAPAQLDIGEQSYQLEARYSPVKNVSLLANFARINDLRDNLLYQEIYGMVTWKKPREWTLNAGLQLQKYNQEIYETKPGVPLVETITPFAEFAYKISRKKTLRLEAQYMNTDEDFGSWLFGLLEYSVAPKWIFTLQDMWNIQPTGSDPRIHFYSGYVTHIKGSNRYALGYVRQVEGIVCSGGICRFEPAFNGVKLSVRSTF